MPLSDLTTPCKAICSMSRHFFPVLQPEPEEWFTTGLINGSRLPVIAYFLSSGLSFLAVSFSWLAAVASFDGTTGTAAAFVAGAAEVLAGVIAACTFAGAWFGLVNGVAVLVGTSFTSGLLAAAFAGAAVTFAGVVAALAGMTAGFAGVVAVFAGIAAGFTGAAVVLVGTLTGLIEIT